jgi:MoaA/NifB/PqqE/SkfB family radical SAM enzyme
MPYCKALYNHLFVDVQGNFAPCCFYKDKGPYNQKNITWKNFYNSNYMNQIRNNMLEGWDPGCINCKNLEEQNLQSYRQIVDIYCKSSVPVIEYIEISCNNQCNIRCRMCGPTSSSKWANTLGIAVESIENFKFFLAQIDTSNIKVVKYLGGEPFITPEIKILLEWMTKIPNKVTFYCNTNLTIFPKKYLDILQSFESIIIGYSIDGVGSVNDYIRQDSKWKSVLDNLEQWESFKTNTNLITYVHTTVQAYNFHNLKKIKAEICDFYQLHHSAFKLNSPAEFTLNALPKQYIDVYTDDYNKKFLFDYNYNNNLYNKLKSKTIYQDKLLKKEIKKFIPELAQWI